MASALKPAGGPSREELNSDGEFKSVCVTDSSLRK